MSRARVLLVVAVLAVIAGGSLYDIFMKVEHWPFSPYRLYTVTQTEPVVRTYRLVGVTLDGAGGGVRGGAGDTYGDSSGGASGGGGEGEVALTDQRYLYPLDNARLVLAFYGMNVNPQLFTNRDGRDSDVMIAAGLRDCLLRYEARRIAGRHDGPALRGLRLYDMHWQLDPMARNAATPDEKLLLAELILPVEPEL